MNDIYSNSAVTEAALSNLREALASCTHPRLFQTERGFQGQLLAELQNRVTLPNQAIIEQEYQKRLYAHGLTIRPDIVIHEPYDSKRHPSRSSGNIAVIELKLKATAPEAAADFLSLTAMIKALRYPIGIFINIDSPETHAALIPEEARGRIVSFAVSIAKGKVSIIES